MCWLPDLTDRALRERLRGPDGDPALGGYLGAYAAWQAAGDEDADAAADAWASGLDDLLQWCWRVAIGPLLELLRPAASRVALVAAGPLGVIPLHAAWTADAACPTGRRYALDAVAFTYASNAVALTAARRAAGARADGALLAVENPATTPELDLPTAAYEVAAVRRHFPNATVLRGADAAPERVLAALPAAAVVHLCCHGRAEMDSPLASAVQLANGTTLTIAEMLRLRLDRCRLVVLSGCETAVAGTRLPDEVVSLQSALLQAGAAATVATSWSIYDTSATLVVARFYAAWRDQPTHEPPEALRLAQRWLRDSTNQEKRDWLTAEVALRPLVAELLVDIDAAIVADGPYARSFGGPLHWAAFSYAGW